MLSGFLTKLGIVDGWGKKLSNSCKAINWGQEEKETRGKKGKGNNLRGRRKEKSQNEGSRVIGARKKVKHACKRRFAAFKKKKGGEGKGKKE